MTRSLGTTLVLLGYAVGIVNAQQPLYAQCGGIGWTGGTTCTSGAVCTKYSDYYSQCVPATSASGPSTGASTSSTTSRVTTTSTSRVTSTLTSTTSAAPQPSGAGPSRLVGKTPALGWNSWNAYQGNINEAKIRAAADALVSLGLKDAGYTYVNIDDCWSNITGRDTGTNRIKPDLNKFPNGIKSVADYVHSLGLLVGIYSDAGTLTCAGFPGSLGYENTDAQTFAEWGVDYLKYDNCNVPGNWSDTYNGPDFDWYNSNSGIRYRQMTTALASVASIRPIQYGICNWGNADVWTWGSRVGHSWRMSGDSSASWSYITSIIAKNVDYLKYVEFYGHNDMDMMEIGNGALTVNEQRTHFAMWAALKSPILLGTDLSKLNAAQLAIIKNAELLAFSQDTTVGAPAKPYKTGTTTPPEYYAGKSAKGTHVFIMNVGSSPASKVVTFSELTGLSCTNCKVHDMWTGKDLGTFTTSYTLTVDTHDTAALLLI
ncbi:glycoside hydrolase superfamily [Rhizoctonia solani]|nr:glycoside hydrolase superfamily [Rhizoctonia solani]